MMQPAHTGSLAFARARDAHICWLLETHPVTAGMLVELGWFSNRGKALKRLRRLTEKKRIRLVGTICEKPGRPQHAFCRYRPKADQLLHEVELTRVCLRLDAGKILRGPEIENTDLAADAEVWINGQRYYLELDRGTSCVQQVVRRRFAKYEGCTSIVLWVCPTEAIRDGRRRHGQAIRSIALFTTFAEILADPHGAIWIDYGGARTSLPRQGDTNPG